MQNPTAPAVPERLRIELLYLDLTSCTRCRGADRGLEEALALASGVLEARGTEVEVERIHVDSAERARELRFVSSPTIRVNGADIAVELRESPCGSEACTDGCGEQIACRVWVHRGKEYTEPPAALIVDAILREVYAGAVTERDAVVRPYRLPGNLEQFFAGKAAAGSAETPESGACCSPAAQQTCCAAEEKAECCGAATGESCGCR
jgi:hypothetical protein